MGYSFETSKVSDGKMIFRAGFGRGQDIIEGEVSLSLTSIIQIIINDNQLAFVNFADPSQKREKSKIKTREERAKLFMSKQRKVVKK